MFLNYSSNDNYTTLFVAPYFLLFGSFVLLLVVVRKTLHCCLKKNLNAYRPSEHSSVRKENVKTFGWDRRLQILLFLTFGVLVVNLGKLLYTVVANPAYTSLNYERVLNYP